ncbi:DNA polymerase III subunit alpha [Hartmannibacter diazotrophicus]|uniref:DNA polymerase III subunit alpha n=1 Tax=Hartmannibacter diazotrophicus TaxID=1482074 RepID=A0A2C9D3T3_9HYPH|nr:DNA polymerase III subunit alpha [Hartmannibacter diazotrophicus]SON54934.1 DNA polymerase III subunit alpha [Hartmannibacter diazotrophicus]
MAALDFVHLRVHSAYSLLEGALPLGKVIDLALKDNQPAVAMTDTGNLFGALEFSEKASGAGLQPIIGCALAIDFHDEAIDPRKVNAGPVLYSLLLIAATEQGFNNLVTLVSKSFLGPEPGLPAHVPIEALEGLGEGIICLTGGPALGPIDRAISAGHPALADDRLERLSALFGDRLYVEIQRHGLDSERMVEAGLIDLAYARGLPLVATNECFFPSRESFEAHDALIAISEGRVLAEDDRRRLTPDHYFKTRAEMVEVFKDLPEALENTVEIARRCQFRPRKRKPILPRFAGADVADVAEAERAEAGELERQAREGLADRLDRHGMAPGLTREDYEKRLEFELSIITGMKFPGYFLIVADFIKWAKAHGIPVGPGRGSGAGSLVAYSLTITDLDPMRFALLFERFLNPERVSMPDFDIDFCQDRRDEVIRYVQEKYGREQVAQIITFGTLQARAVLRDVGRVLQMPYGQVDRLCKLVPQNPANPVTLAQAITDEPRLREARREEEIVDRLLDMALKLEGLYRHASTHAAGIVIGDRPLDRLVPLYRDPRSDMPVTQYNMKWVESAGLVKFDFLGLKTLTVLQKAVNLIERRGVKIDLSALPLDDPKTYGLLQRGETVGVFQLESMGMRKAIADIKPDCFEDIIALVALYRPGPMANIPVYGARKHGHEKPDYIHPKLEPVLKETYGIIVYQEQVMQIAQILSGYSLGEADLLRRAMGKKIKAEMDVQRVRFVEGAQKDGLDKAEANTIFDLLAKFADYGFNKSHAAAYALVAYQTAYLKANYPVEFMAASMTLDMGNTDKLNDFRREAMRLGFEVLPPCVNRSDVEFEVSEDRILYALAAIKGVGRQAVEHLVEVRGERKFSDLSDFAARIGARMLNKRMMESLVAAGAFDALESNRARMFSGIEQVLGAATDRAEREASGQNELFGGAAEVEPVRLGKIPEWLPEEKLQREHAAIGFYLSAHPLDAYKAVLSRLRVQTFSEFSAAVKRGAGAGRLAGTIVSRQERKTKSGNKMGILGISDPTGQFEAVIFSEGLNHYREVLEPGRSVIILVGAEDRPEGISIRIDSAEPLDEAAARLQHSLRVFLRSAEPVDSLRNQLAPSGDGDVSLIVLLEEGKREVEVKLPGRYRVSPQIAGALKAIPGVVDVELA